MRIHPRFHVLLLALCLLPAASSLAESTPPMDEKPILLSPVEISEKTTRRKVYDAKVENLWDAKQKKRTISYLEVLTSAYDTSRFDLVQCLLEKKTYRETVARKHPFYCNYAAATIEVEIKWTLPRVVMQRSGLKSGEGSTERGVGFDYKDKVIKLSPDAPFPFLLHASGAALSSFPSKKTAEEIQALIAKNENKQFSDHVQFELKLQDLNRYYATFTGTPIMKPLDAVHALAMFGHIPNKNLVASILKRHGVVATEAQLAAALKSDKVKRDGKTTTFELAYRLVDGVSAFGITDEAGDDFKFGDPEDMARFQVEAGLNQKSRAEYAAMLEQIIIQAPGHI